VFGEKHSAAEIFEAAASGKEYSRQELSRLTGYSLMTVGKAVSALEKGNLIYQTKHSGGTVGRNMSLCSVNSDCGMLIYDLTKTKPVITVWDMRLDLKGEAQSDHSAIASLMAEGFGYYTQLMDGMLLGMGCIVPEGREAELAGEIKAVFGNPPELTVSPRFASAAAAISDISPEGTALIIRAEKDKYDAVLWRNGFIKGAHGRAADVSFIKDDAGLITAAADFCMMTDPEAVHISAENGSEISKKIISLLVSRGVPEADVPRMIIRKPCDDAGQRGTAIMLRREIIIRIAEENS